MKVILAIFFTSLFSVAQSQNNLPYQNAKLSIDLRVKDLLGRMTIEEKAGQLNQLNGGAFTGPALKDEAQKNKIKLVQEGKVGSLLNVIGTKETRAIQEAATKSRLKIPLLFGLDVIHGYKTIFPIPLAEACSWNLDQIELNSSIAAKEAASAGIHWTFAPMCDISNDPRWGRVMEGAGEDPYLASVVSAKRVKGFQGNLKGNENILACVKHFAAYGAVEGGREYNTVDVSRFQLWNKYLPSYKAAVEAGAATVMNSFNIVEGVPASGNKYLVNDVLKKKWGFKGFLVSDWGSFNEMMNHGYAKDSKDAALKAMQAGSMMDMESSASYKFIPELIKEGKLTVAQLDEAVGKILHYKFKLGLFEDPFYFCNSRKEMLNLLTDEHRSIARQAAVQSIVMLKNNESILPLKNDVKISLIGHYAESKEDMFDFWVAQGKTDEAVSILEGLEQRFNGNVTYAKGYLPDNTTTETLISEAIQKSVNADVIVVNIGISGKMAGEDRALAQPEISQGQLELLKALRKLGKPIVALVSSGRPLVLTEAEKYVEAILQTWILGTETGNAIADVLSGDQSPTGKTVMSFPYAVGQIPVYYNHFNTNRPAPSDPGGDWYSRYRDIPNEPLYPFGFGLTYTQFGYSDMKISKNSMSKSDTLTVKVTLSNQSEKEGEEIVQLYIRDHVASLVRPVKELKAFQRVKMAPADVQEVTFKISAKDLSFYDTNGNPVLEPGKFSVFVGSNSRDVTEAVFELK
jgi:beta-glucosidase